MGCSTAAAAAFITVFWRWRQICVEVINETGRQIVRSEMDRHPI